MKKLRLSTFRIGAAARRGEGLRIGKTRRPPRGGVRKSRWVRDGYFDVWLPALAPSSKLLLRFKKSDFDDASVRKAFFDAYERELLTTAEGRQTVQFVAEVAARTPISVGCFCQDESRCHRSRLIKIIQKFAPVSRSSHHRTFWARRAREEPKTVKVAIIPGRVGSSGERISATVGNLPNLLCLADGPLWEPDFKLR